MNVYFAMLNCESGWFARFASNDFAYDTRRCASNCAKSRRRRLANTPLPR